MKVTTEGERVIDLLWDVIAAKGFEGDMYFEMARPRHPRAAEARGTVHVNMALVLKFMAAFLFDPQEFEPVGEQDEPVDDEFLFRQGPARGLSKIRFHDWRQAYDAFAQVPNVARFVEQAEGLKTLLSTAPPSEEQIKDLDFMLTLGELFTLIVYGQLICEQAELEALERGHDRPDLRRPRARLLGLRGLPARARLVDRGPAGVGARQRAQAGSSTANGLSASGSGSAVSRARTRCGRRPHLGNVIDRNEALAALRSMPSLASGQAYARMRDVTLITWGQLTRAAEPDVAGRTLGVWKATASNGPAPAPSS